MKLRNKKTGDVFNFTIKAEQDPTTSYFKLRTGSGGWEDGLVYGTIDELQDEWEDYEEPKNYWTVECGEPFEHKWINDSFDRDSEAAGLKFDTKEECERAIEKLKAWKRLKDKGFRFYDWKSEATYRVAFDWNPDIKVQEVQNDLDLLFGGEDE